MINSSTQRHGSDQKVKKKPTINNINAVNITKNHQDFLIKSEVQINNKLENKFVRARTEYATYRGRERNQ